jgi:hypothetical protein
MLFYFGGQVAAHASDDADKFRVCGKLPVAVLGNGAKMLYILYQRLGENRQNDLQFEVEMKRFKTMFAEGGGFAVEDIDIFITEIPKEEAAFGLVLASDNDVVQANKSRGQSDKITDEPFNDRIDTLSDQWADQNAHMEEMSTIHDELTDQFKSLVNGSFYALRKAFIKDSDFKLFLETLFRSPENAYAEGVESFMKKYWQSCLKINAYQVAKDEKLPKDMTIAGRYAVALLHLNSDMYTV